MYTISPLDILSNPAHARPLPYRGVGPQFGAIDCFIKPQSFKIWSLLLIVEFPSDNKLPLRVRERIAIEVIVDAIGK